jgi:signal transduction histidine kinase
MQPIQNSQLDWYLKALHALQTGNYDAQVLRDEAGSRDCLMIEIQKLAEKLKRDAQETQKLNALTANINAGLTLEDILERVYQDFREVIPYNRIGFSIIEDGNIVRARWAKTDQKKMYLTGGYSAALEGSSLEGIIKSGEPRILNDLQAYYDKKPTSESTRMMLKEGIRSSLTCPLVANNSQVGFIFFSSIHPNTYDAAHVDIFKHIAGQLSVIVEKGRLVSALSDQRDAIQKQNEELRHLNELKNQFLGIAAHDLRSPLSSIRIGLDVLMADAPWLSRDEREHFLHTFFETLDYQTRRMLDLLNDLLDVTQIELGELKLKVVSIELDRFLEQSVMLHAQMARPKSKQVLLEAAPHIVVVADPMRLGQVMDNLLTNAVKFSPVNSTVKVSVQPDGSGWRVNVRDEGPGIAEEDRQKLFQDFARLSARPSGGEKSTGLGLAIARRIVHAHGGEIGVDSIPGKGATFWFTLPG